MRNLALARALRGLGLLFVRFGVVRMTQRLFGTDGVRGRANEAITPDLALRIGQAAGRALRRGDHRQRAIIGKDTRLSGYMIETALVAGLTSVGVDALLLGPMPTPRRRHAHPRHARRPRRDDLRLPQSVRGQWHQIVRAGWL
jgi:hypothetical protein